MARSARMEQPDLQARKFVRLAGWLSGLVGPRKPAQTFQMSSNTCRIVSLLQSAVEGVAFQFEAPECNRTAWCNPRLLTGLLPDAPLSPNDCNRICSHVCSSATVLRTEPMRPPRADSMPSA